MGEPGALSGVTRCCGGDLLKKRRIALRLRARGPPALGTRCLGHLLKRRMLGTAARAPRPGRIYEMAPAHGCPERFRRRYNLAQRLLCDAAARTPHRTGRARAPFSRPRPPSERSGGAPPAREDACARALSTSSAASRRASAAQSAWTRIDPEARTRARTHRLCAPRAGVRLVTLHLLVLLLLLARFGRIIVGIVVGTEPGEGSGDDSRRQEVGA